MADTVKPPSPDDGRARLRAAFKRSVLAMLLVLNGLLVLALLTAGGVLPTARAQVGARGASYLCVTAKSAGQSYDVLYVLDQTGRQLHAFYPGQGQARQLTRAEPRDLAKDFGN